MTEVIETIAGLRARLEGAGSVALVATMGALHDGHLSLVRHAAQIAETVVVSIFVNPMQFDQRKDLDKYPRDLNADLRVLPAGVIVFAPPVEELYPQGESSTVITAGDVGTRFEGTIRPGHFDGMLTVVAKLMHLTRCDAAYFGQKDAQQLLLIRRMCRDLDFAVRVVAVPTVREPDGLAMSSRNTYLTDSDRETASCLSAALRAGAAVAAEGPSAVRRAARAVLVREPLALVDYLVLVYPDTLVDVPEWYRGEALLAVAGRVGTTRLIDNLPLLLGPEGSDLEVFTVA